MTDYNQLTFFGPKDSLTSSDPAKVIRGAEFDTEFAALAAAIATKLDDVGLGLSLVGGTLVIDFPELASAAPALADQLVVLSSANGNLNRRVSVADLVALASSDLDTSDIPDLSTVVSTDGFLMETAAGPRIMPFSKQSRPSRDINSGGDYTVLTDDVSRIIWWNQLAAANLILGAGVGQDDCSFTVVNQTNNDVVVSGTVALNGIALGQSPAPAIPKIAAGSSCNFYRKENLIWHGDNIVF